MGFWHEQGGRSLSGSWKFYFDARNVPTILVAGGVLLIVIGVLLNAAVWGSGTAAIFLGFVLIMLGLLVYAFERSGR